MTRFINYNQIIIYHFLVQQLNYVDWIFCRNIISQMVDMQKKSKKYYVFQDINKNPLF